MLGKEDITGNEALKGLTEEQVAAIVTLSDNAFDKAVKSKIGELHGLYDKDIKEVTGVDRNAGEKTYEYLKRVYSGLKEQAASVETKDEELSRLKAEYEELKKGGSTDEVVKKDLADSKKKIADLESLLQQTKGEFEAASKDFQSKETKMRGEFELRNTLSSLTYKDDTQIPSSVKKVVQDNAVHTILSTYTPELKDGATIWRDKEGNIVANKGNLLKPMTAADLLKPHLTDILGADRKVAGTGGKGSGGGNGGFDIGDAKTQVEADRLITQHLLAQGVLRTSKDWNAKFAQIRKEAGVSELKLR